MRSSTEAHSKSLSNGGEGEIRLRLSARRRSPRSSRRLAVLSADKTSLRRSNPARDASSCVAFYPYIYNNY